MAKIGITVSADKKSISKVNHTVNDALKNEYNEYLRKIKTISLLKLITSLLGIIILLSAICFFTDIFLDFIPKSLPTYITIIITVFALSGILAVLLDVVRQKSTDIDQLLYLTKGKNITYDDFAVYRISPFADKFKLYFMYDLAYTKPHILSVDVYVLQDSKNAVLNIVYVDGSTITSFTTKLIDIQTDCNYINEPELHYDSDFKLFLPHNQLREYYKVNIDDFKAVVDSFKLS